MRSSKKMTMDAVKRLPSLATLMTLGLIGFSVCAQSRETAQGDGPAVSVQAELLRDLCERQALKIEALEHDLGQTQRDLATLEAALVEQDQDVLTWLKDLQASDLSPQDKAEAEAAKRNESAAAAERLRAKRTVLSNQQALTTERIHREKTRLHRLQALLDPRLR